MGRREIKEWGMRHFCLTQKHWHVGIGEVKKIDETEVWEILNCFETPQWDVLTRVCCSPTLCWWFLSYIWQFLSYIWQFRCYMWRFQYYMWMFQYYIWRFLWYIWLQSRVDYVLYLALVNWLMRCFLSIAGCTSCTDCNQTTYCLLIMVIYYSSQGNCD